MSLRIYPRRNINLPKGYLKIAFSLIISGRLRKGLHIKNFEEKFAEYIEAKAAFGVSSATFGLYLALEALNFEKDSEVILSSYNFYSIPLVLKMMGLKPIFIDVRPETYNIDPLLIREKITTRTKALIITHMYGNPCKMDLIMEICKEKKIILIEDCAHACGASYKGRKVGSFGDIAIFSFALGKNICCFGGGMLVVNNEDLLDKIKRLVNKYPRISNYQIIKNIIITIAIYILTNKLIFSIFVYPFIKFFINLFPMNNFIRRVPCLRFTEKNKKLLSNFQAAIGELQLERLDKINAKLKKNAENLNLLLQSVDNIKLPLHEFDCEHIYSYYKIRVKNRSFFIRRLINKGIVTETDNMFDCSGMSIFSEEKNLCRNAKIIFEESVEIPNGVKLEDADLKYIAKQISEVANFNYGK